MDSPRLLTGLFLALTLGLAACAANPPPADATSPIIVTLHSSGGIAGVTRALSVARDGTVTLRDERRNTSRSGHIDPTAVAEIDRLVAALPLEQGRLPGPACPDCMRQEFVFERAGKVVRRVPPARAAADSADGQLLRRLSELAAGLK